MSRILHRGPGALPIATGGKGCQLFDSEGRAYLDASGGAAVSSLGHGHPQVLSAIEQQIRKIAYAHTSFFTTEVAEELADLLVESAPAGISNVYFVSGGSEAVEAALKLARQYFVEIGQTERRHVIARRQSYHGNTLGALAVGGSLRRRRAFGPLLIATHHIDPCFAYHEQRPGETDDAYAKRSAGALETKLLELGPQNVMAFVAETVVGATAGAVPAVGGYFKLIRDICDRHGVLLILDEVMCGMGRTGTLHACEQEGIVPDLLTVAKGLGGGYQPIGAVLLSQRIFNAIAGGSGFFEHGHTYIGHATACAAALAVQRIIRRDGLLEHVVEMGRRLDERLRDRIGQHTHVGDIRGRGLLRGVEFVQNRSEKSAFDPERRIAATIKREAMERGLMVYPGTGTLDGVKGDHVLLAPPFIVDATTIEIIVERLASAIDAAIPGPNRAFH